MHTPTSYSVFVTVFLAATHWSQIAHSHGTPIRVDLVDNRLVVSQGITDASGFAPMIFVENNEAGESFGSSTFADFGPANLWQIPGYEIYGLAEGSGLFIEPIARPVKNSNPTESRVLWYWNPATELVERAIDASKLQIRRSASENTTLFATSEISPPSLQLAAPLSSEMGSHKHLVLYALNESAPNGAYGFFARLTSNVYAPSEPFLLVINHGIVDYENMILAAVAINAAAVASVPGDFNHDGTVDAADYTVWRDGLGITHNEAQYDEWKANFGQSAGTSSRALTTAAAPIPEPGVVTIACGLLGLPIRFRLRSTKARKN